MINLFIGKFVVRCTIRVDSDEKSSLYLIFCIKYGNCYLKKKEMRISYETCISCDFFDIVYDIYYSDGSCAVDNRKV